MYKKLAFSGLCFLLASCSLFEKDKIALDGERISVLDNESALQPDYAPGEVKIVLPRPEANTSWTQNGGNSEHLMGHLLTGNKLKAKWDSGFGEGSSRRDFLIASPVIAHKVVFTIDAEAVVSAFRLDNGKKIWKRRLKPLNKDDKAISMKGAGVAVMNKKVYATTGFGGVFALDMISGKKIWRYDAETPIRIAPTVAEDKVLVQTIDNLLIALNPETGEELWRYKSSQEATVLVGGASPAYSPKQDVVIAAFSTGELRAFKASTGSPLWADILVSGKRKNSLTDINAIKASPVIDGDRVYAVGNNNVLAAIDLRSGARIWELEIGGVNQPWIAGKYLFVLSNDLDLLAVETASGKIVWNTKIPTGNSIEDKVGVFATGPVLTDNRLLITTSNGYAFAVSPYTGKFLSFVSLDDGVELPPAVAYGYTVLTTKDAELLAYK